MSKQFWAVIIVIVAVLIGVFAFTGKKDDSGSAGKVGLSHHITGQGASGVTLVEYGDYQCPFCGEYYTTLKQVLQEYDKQIYFQFRNFPLTSLHPNAFAGARAAEAASLQGKFWEMHDLLYQNQDQNGASGWVASSDPLNKYFVSFAQQLGLNVAQFKEDFGSDKVNAQVNADLAEANRLGLTGTPAFFVDGKQVQISNTLADFQKILDAEIKKKGGTPPAHTTSASPSPTESTSQTKQ